MVCILLLEQQAHKKSLSVLLQLVIFYLQCTLNPMNNDITPVHVVSRVLLHATECIPLPVQPVSQERVEYVCV